MTDSTTPSNIRRTWKVSLYGHYGDGAPLRLGSNVVTAQADCQGQRSAWVDGQPVSYQQAARLLNWARDDGQVELLEECRPFAGKPAGHALHRLLGELGYREHYRVASEALERDVRSLANLTVEELRRVQSYAYGQLGMVG